MADKKRQRVSKEEIKNHFFKSNQFEQLFKDFCTLKDLSPQQLRNIKTGRFKTQFNQLKRCQQANFIGFNECFKQTLHSQCQRQFNQLTITINQGKDKNIVHQKIAKYIHCLQKINKNIYLSSIRKF